jgi:hypothetical protein
VLRLGRAGPRLREIGLVLKNAVTFRASKVAALLGNHVIVRTSEFHALYAHLAVGSVAVRDNSTAPHLHFQLMDRPDLLKAVGIPCAFREYEVLRDGRWERVERAIPLKTDRIRSTSHGDRGTHTLSP